MPKHSKNDELIEPGVSNAGYPMAEDGSALPRYEANENGPLPQHVSADRLARKLSARQVQMIAIGGTIGTGLFLGTGKSLSEGGPGSMLICYLIGTN